jgi:hypothetical protein
MSKLIQKAIAKRILEVEANVLDSLQFTAAKYEYIDLFLTILNQTDLHTKSLVERMDGLTDPILFSAIRKAYYAGLQDGMKVGEVTE